MTAAAGSKVKATVPAKTADKRTPSEKNADDEAQKARDELKLKESTAETKAKESDKAPDKDEPVFDLDQETVTIGDDLYIKESRVRNLIEDAREASESSSPAEESDDQDPVDANDLLNQAWSSLAAELDDGVAKDQVLGALTAVQLRAREVVLEHAARRKAE